MGKNELGVEPSSTYVEKAVSNRTTQSVRSFFDVLIITIIVLLVVTEVVLNSYKLIEKNKIAKDEIKIQESILKAREFNEISKTWDALFEKGEYDELCEAYDEVTRENKAAHYYKHQPFIYEYSNYLDADTSIDNYLSEGSAHSVNSTTSLLYNCINFINGYDHLGNEASAKEKDVIAKKKAVIFIRARVALGLSEEEFNTLMNRVGNPGSVVSYSKCNEIAKEMVGAE